MLPSVDASPDKNAGSMIGAPVRPSGNAVRPIAASARSTPGRCANSLVKFGPYTPLRFMSEGFVLARNVENEDWVRRAAAREPIPIPPARPISNTIDR